MILQHQLVRRDTHMEGIGLGPALRYQKKVADSEVGGGGERVKGGMLRTEIRLGENRKSKKQN